MAQNSDPNSAPQPSSGEKHFFRSKETVDIVDPAEVAILTRDRGDGGTTFSLNDLISERYRLISKMHKHEWSKEEFAQRVENSAESILPVTPEELDDPSNASRQRKRAQLQYALGIYDDDAFADVCIKYMRTEARLQDKHLTPDVDKIKSLVSTKIDATDKYRAELTDDEYSIAEKIAEEYAEDFIAAMVKRSKKSLETSRKSERIDTIRENLADMLSGLASDIYFNLDSHLSEVEKAQQVDEFIKEVGEEVISMIEEKRKAEYDKARPMMKKFYDKWASWGKGKEDGSYKSNLLTKGKLKKAAVIAVPTAIVTAVAAPFVTTGLATGAAGAVAFMGARSVGRRLAGAKLDRASNITTVAHEQAELLRAGIDEKKSTEQDRPADEVDGSDEHKARVELNVDHNAILEMIDKQSDYIRQRNLRRNLTGTAIALTVGLLSSRAASAVEGFVNYIQDDRTSGGRVEKEGGRNRDRDGDGVPNRDDYRPNNPDVQTPSDIDGNSGADTLDRSDMFDGHQGSREFTAEGQKDFNRWISRNGGYEVKPGDSVWKLSERYLEANGNPNPTTYEVDAVKDSVLKELQAKGMADSRGWLTTGDTIKIK